MINRLANYEIGFPHLPGGTILLALPLATLCTAAFLFVFFFKESLESWCRLLNYVLQRCMQRLCQAGSGVRGCLITCDAAALVFRTNLL